MWSYAITSNIKNKKKKIFSKKFIYQLICVSTHLFINFVLGLINHFEFVVMIFLIFLPAPSIPGIDLKFFVTFLSTFISIVNVCKRMSKSKIVFDFFFIIFFFCFGFFFSVNFADFWFFYFSEFGNFWGNFYFSIK